MRTKNVCRKGTMHCMCVRMRSSHSYVWEFVIVVATILLFSEIFQMIYEIWMKTCVTANSKRTGALKMRSNETIIHIIEL